MSHVGFQDSYEPPRDTFDADAAEQRANMGLAPSVKHLLNDIEQLADEWHADFCVEGSDWRVADIDQNPLRELLLEAYEVARSFIPRTDEVAREAMRKRMRERGY